MYIVFGNYNDYYEYVIGCYDSLKEAKAIATKETRSHEAVGVEKLVVGPRKGWLKVYNTEFLRCALLQDELYEEESE